MSKGSIGKIIKNAKIKDKQFLEYIKIAEVDSALELAKRYLELR